jgi:hypothetical protein
LDNVCPSCQDGRTDGRPALHAGRAYVRLLPPVVVVGLLARSRPPELASRAPMIWGTAGRSAATNYYAASWLPGLFTVGPVKSALTGLQPLIHLLLRAVPCHAMQSCRQTPAETPHTLWSLWISQPMMLPLPLTNYWRGRNLCNWAAAMCSTLC